MLNISKAQAFAITIENKGSSKSTPNLPGMVVAGEVKNLVLLFIMFSL
jgi:hypothetical protein